MNKANFEVEHSKKANFNKGSDIKPRQYRTAIYARLSDEDTNKNNPEDDSNSIQHQKSMLIEYAMQQGWEIAGVYSDDDFSGGSINRPEFKRMLADCEEGKIDIVLCKTQSRFSRDMEVIERYLHNKFIAWNVRFVSIVDHADTSVKGNKKARQINGLVNEWYLEELSDNIKEVIHFKKKQGEFTGSFAPYGYLVDPEDKHHLIPDPEAKEYIKKIFELYASGYGYSKIAAYLTNNDIPTPSKMKIKQGSKFVCCHARNGSDNWNKDTIRKILMNETYIGNLVQGKVENLDYKDPKKKKYKTKDEWIVAPGTHEPIIDKATWDIVQSKFSGRLNKAPKTAYSTGEVHLFSRKVYCLNCGKTMVRNLCNSTTGKIVYLNCRTHRSNPLSCMNKRLLRYDYLEELILEELNKLIAKYKNASLLEITIAKQYKLEEEHKKKIAELKLERERLEQALERKTNTLKSLYLDKETGIITTLEFSVLKQDWNKDMQNIKTSLEEIETRLKETENKKTDNITIESLIEKYNKIETLDRNIIDTFIHCINVGAMDEESQKRKIQIEWKF